jgi:DNA-binding transcriptional ArsR family regulator
MVPVSSNLRAERTAELLRALGDATRLRLIDALSRTSSTLREDGREGASVGVLALASSTTLANASRHLLLLAQLGLVTRHKVGAHVYYELADPAVLEILRATEGLLDRAVAAEHEALLGGTAVRR